MEVDTIKNIEDITRITSERERIGAELSLASGIQNGMLPSHNQMLDDVEGFEIFATMDPAKEVGGDFYDFYMIDDTHLAMLIADVSDKGVGAAFFMAIAKTLIKARALMGGSPVEIITYADKLISEKNPEGMFVTVWLGIIDLETGHMDICNAGHDYPAVMKDNKKYVIEKTPHGPAVAFLPGVEFVETELDLKPGDRIFLYTDGLNEAKGMDGDRFGLDRMLSVLNIYNGLNDKELIAEMKKNVDK